MLIQKLILLLLVLSLFGCGNIDLQPAQKESPSVTEIIPPTDIVPEEAVDLFPELPAIDLFLIASNYHARNDLIELLSVYSIDVTEEQRADILEDNPDIDATLKFKVALTQPYDLLHGILYQTQLPSIPYELTIRVKNSYFKINHLNAPLDHQGVTATNIPITRLYATRMDASPEHPEIAYSQVSGSSRPVNTLNISIVSTGEYRGSEFININAGVWVHGRGTTDPSRSGRMLFGTSTQGLVNVTGPSFCNYIGTAIARLCR